MVCHVEFGCSARCIPYNSCSASANAPTTAIADLIWLQLLISLLLQQFVKEVGGGGGSINNAQFVNLMVRSLSAVNVQSLGISAFDTSAHNGTAAAAAATADSSSTPHAQPSSTFRAIVQSASKLALVKLGLAKEHEEEAEQEHAATTAANSIVSSSSKHGTSASCTGSDSQAVLDAEQLKLAEEAERSTRQHGHVYSSSGNIEIDGVVYDGIEF
jgi:hypothetical protein